MTSYPAEPLGNDSGILELCQAVAQDPQKAWDMTSKGRTVALISDGSDIPGLGPIGPAACLPYLESQASFLRKVTCLKVLPLALNTRSAEELVSVTNILSPSCGALCLDSLGDEIFLTAERLLAPLELPVFFNPQQSRPILALAALSRALAKTGRDIAACRIVLSGFESDSVQFVDFLLAAGAVDLVVCDRLGAIHKGRPGPTSWLKEHLAQKTNPKQIKGSLARTLAGADVFISRASPLGLSKDMVASMADRPVILNFSPGLLNPGVLATGNNPVTLGVGPGPPTRLPASLNTALVLAGLFTGTLKTGAGSITMAMRLAVSQKLSSLADDSEDRLLPLLSKPSMAQEVAEAVMEAAGHRAI
ncbi:MAG: hypothetical protein LBP22_10230 [Deltaproteobacteria bacterium]|jgi:malate dehydrogenase (oxaloacetate-decarboxylating)|nr:hypothetical protein [Deltaproteobacteria bacterium]